MAGGANLSSRGTGESRAGTERREQQEADMPGILVGVDGSGHSQRALEWAMKEAGLRQVPLTVLTVHQAVAGYYGGVSVYSDDDVHTEQVRQAAQAETDKVLASLADPKPASVT